LPGVEEAPITATDSGANMASSLSMDFISFSFGLIYNNPGAALLIS
jgi:hypothetical protein